jgi:acetate kinase
VTVLVVNSGSTSLKVRLVGPDDEVLATCDGPADSDVADVVTTAVAGRRVDAVGHRIVHGGASYAGPVVVDAEVRAGLGELVTLAPLHQPAGLRALDVVTRLLPDVPAVACFDTAFHATLPPAASTYAVPVRWREELGVRRYGFHGLSHAWVARCVGDGRVVSCHLGGGASLAAVRDGVCVDTTMGFTPLEGLVMATRSGSVDPGLVLWLQQQAGMSADEVGRVLTRESGLRGLAGTSAMSDVVAGAHAGDERCALALEVYLHRLRAGIAAMAAALDGLDTLVFTGGVGENVPRVRELAVAGLGFLGDVPVRVIPAREELEIARLVRSVIQGTQTPTPGRGGAAVY